jgi:hypothetical protein
LQRLDTEPNVQWIGPWRPVSASGFQNVPWQLY